jgi:hypothetical protein
MFNVMGEKIMITQIGIASGEILNLIDNKKRPVSIAEIKSYLRNEKELTYMSIGWLVREGHVQLVDTGKEKYLCKS